MSPIYGAAQRRRDRGFEVIKARGLNVLIEARIQSLCSSFLQDSDRHHTGMSYAHSQNAASIGREYKLLLERNAARWQRQRGRSSALLFMVSVPASVGVSVLSSYLWISLLVGVENLFGCSRAGRFTQLVPCTV